MIAVSVSPMYKKQKAKKTKQGQQNKIKILFTFPRCNVSGLSSNFQWSLSSVFKIKKRWLSIITGNLCKSQWLKTTTKFCFSDYQQTLFS